MGDCEDHTAVIINEKPEQQPLTEQQPPDHTVITKKPGVLQTLRKTLSFMKPKVHWLIIGFLLLVIIGLIIIIARPTHKCTDHVTDTKNQNSAPCEKDWIWYRGKCYYFSTTKDTWSNSRINCTSYNASLALIDNKQELEFLVRNKGEENHWIGLRRTEDNTAWTWANGTLYNETLFTIKRTLEEGIEYVYLNHGDVRSVDEIRQFRWICKRM